MSPETEDIKRHFDVVAESLRSEIRLVAEGVVGIDEKFSQEFIKVREEIDGVKALLRTSYTDLRREFREEISDVKAFVRASYQDLRRQLESR